MKKKITNSHLWMKKLCCILLALAMVFSNVTIAKAETAVATTEAELITKVNPYLKSYEVSEADQLWTVESGMRFVVEANDANLNNERLAEVVKLINAELVEKEISAAAHAMVYSTAATAADIFVRLVPVADITGETTSEEAYKITISASGVVVEAASETAAMYALRTIEQLMMTNNGLVYGTIVDYPDMAERRLHVDAGRKYFSKDWFIREIREMSYLKMNALQLHFAENLGFRIECETDPQIVSKDHLAKADVREILAEAEKYGVKIIPSLDTPGHVQHILQFHPEYGQVDVNGNHSTTALDITNPEAVKYIYSLYDEYMELFKGCETFHIGADEYMEYDRSPFTTSYKPVLDDYAVEKYGAGYTWKEAMAGYTNDLAAYVYSKGFKPRIFNDGVYFNESYSNQKQKFDMHDYIGIDYWSRTSWIGGSPSLETFINRGHKEIYNFNSSYFYYVLRNGVQSDGRPANSFDVKEQYKNIYNNWTPGKFSGSTIADDHESIAGASLGIWCDYPDIVTEDVVHTDIAKEMRSLACKSWETTANSIMGYDAFAALTDELGHVAAYEKGSVLPEVGEFMEGDELGKITIKFADTDGKELKADRIVYGMLEDEYDLTADSIYGYRFKEADKAMKGTFVKDDVVITFTYELYTDKEDLTTAVAAEKAEKDYIPATYTAYKEAFAAAKAVLANDKATQAETDSALEALAAAENELVSLDRVALYVELTYPVSNAGYTSTTFNDYTTALAAAETVLYNPEATAEEVTAAFNNVVAKKTSLAVPTDMVTATANKETYTEYSYASGYTYYPLTNALDGNEATKAWTNSAQAEGDWFLFTFAKPVKLNSFRIQFPDNADYIYGADVEISADNSTWTKIGVIDNTSNPQLDITFEANGSTVQYVRMTLTKTVNNWTQITEATFDYEVEGTDNSALLEAVAEAKELNEADYTVPSWKVFAAALAYAETVAADEGATDGEINAAIAAVEACAAALESGSAVPTPSVTEEPQPTETEAPQPTETEAPAPEDDVTKIFDDVYTDWYTDYVQYVYDNNLMTGIKGTKHFAPNANITKAQVAQVLFNMEGQPKVETPTVFTELSDVYTAEWYADAVAWAYSTGVVTGDLNAKKFFPNADVTREQLALMMYRYADYKEYDVTATSDYEGLVNADKVNNWAADGMSWAVGKGLISGIEKNGVKDLAPQGNASRAQVAAILQRFCEAYKAN